MIIKCHYCGEEKRIRKSALGNGNNFCSRKCKDEWQKEGLLGKNGTFYGKSHSDESKKMMSKTKKAQALTGSNSPNYNSYPVSCDECGKITYKIQYLINRSENHFCSVECHGKWKSKNLIGENSPSWNHNLTVEEREVRRKYPEYYSFLNGRLSKDNYTCQICGKHSKWGNGLNVHHLNSYDWDKKNRTNIENAVTLCKECHTEFHKQFGYGKNTKEQFLDFIGQAS